MAEKKQRWIGRVRWRDRGSTEWDSAEATGVAPHDGLIVFEYAWDDKPHIARFELQKGSGTARDTRSGKQVAIFAGSCKIGDGYLECSGGPWVQDGRECDWEVELDDIS